MPDRPKRRKNNKNKRKTKNQRADVNKKDSDVTQTGDIDSCSAETSNLAVDNESVQHEFENESISINISSLDNKINIDNCLQYDTISQDLSNKSDNLECFSGPVSNVMDDNISAQDCRAYIVESPEQPTKNNPKLNSATKSKSLDNDDVPLIVEVTNSISQVEDIDEKTIIDGNNVVVYEVDSDIEWEKINELKSDPLSVLKEHATGTLSITTIPLTVAQCEQTKSLTPEEEMSLRHYLHTLNLSTHPNADTLEIKTEIEQIINREIKHRLRKKGMAEDRDSQTPKPSQTRLGPPRILDVIDEEGSNESSLTSRRQSYLSEKKSDNEDLEDDVFEDEVKSCSKYVTKSVTRNTGHKKFGRLVPQQCMLVGAKIKDPDITEARGNWTVQTVEKMTGAEVVYLTDSSSSTSSIHDLGEETDESVETDVSVRIITPTIEVTDTESLLKNTFISSDNGNQTNEVGSECIKDDCSKDIPESVLIETNEGYEEDILCSVENNFVDHDPHEIIILSTNDIKTNLYVKDVEEVKNNKEYDKNLEFPGGKAYSTDLEKTNTNDINSSCNKDNYNLELKVIKCELNDAINNLIKGVSDSEVSNESQISYVRQDSSSSVCSSQCTAKYNPTHSSLNDVSNIVHDENCENTTANTDNAQMSIAQSHVTDVFECVTGKTSRNNSQVDIDQPLSLKDTCVIKIAKLPYGYKILEELASVSERLQNINIYGLKAKEAEKLTNKEVTRVETMPYYPLPDISNIEKVSISSKPKDLQPPPVQPRNSSLKKSQDENHWTALPSKNEPVYVCLSPSQKMLMEKTNTVITKEDASDLIDTHKKYIDRRGYNEYYKEKETENKPDNDPPVVPFKSQTGSRLLALIRDPSVTYSINTNMNDHYNKSSYQPQGTYTNIANISKNMDKNLNSTRGVSSTFKPIPPPRPKKYSSSFYESDESSDFTDNSFRSMKSERKFFHYSTGNLSKEIENDVSPIQNMHRYFTNMRDHMNDSNFPRRPSLPKDLCEQQMQYIRQKEKEVEAELKRIEEDKHIPLVPKRGPRAPLLKDMENKLPEQNYTEITRGSNKKYSVFNSQCPEQLGNGRLHSLFSSSQEELLRDKMYSEYVNQMAERQERKQHKIIKMTNSGSCNVKKTSKSMSSLDFMDTKVNNKIEKEFISKARERWDKLGIKDPETEDEIENGKDIYREPKIIEHKIKVIEGGKETDVQNLPTHLQDFVRFTAKDKDEGKSSSGESGHGPASPHVILCAVIILLLAVGKYLLRFLRNQ